MKLYFVTGNKGKYDEFCSILKTVAQVEMLDSDIPEIQSLDPKEVLKEKSIVASNMHPGKKILVEDTSLTFEAMNNKLPGPFIKWFQKTFDYDELYNLCKAQNKFGATATVTIGYYDGEAFEFFKGTIEGTITSPKGTNGMGWDQIFIPKGHDKTFAQMTSEEKNSISMRKQALEKLKSFLK